MSLKKNKHIYLQRPILGSYENRLVADCIKRNWVNSGKYIELFEKLTGNAFVPSVGNVKDRIVNNLESSGIM